MLAIVFAKSNSERVPNKNFREFHDGKNLVDIALSKLAFLSRRNIHISTDSVEMLDRYSAQGYGTIHRATLHTKNETPISDVLRDASLAVSGIGGDLMFVMPCDPLLGDYEDIVYTWQAVGHHGYDSLGLVVPQREYLLDSNYQPQGFGFGYAHKPSQKLPVQYRMNFSVSIVDREAFAEAEPYHVLKNPFWYHVASPSVDIDTMSDFRAAQALYARTQ